MQHHDRDYDHTNQQVGVLIFEPIRWTVNNIMSMTTNEKEATLEYLEFNLLSMCDQASTFIDPKVVGHLYELAYEVLNDMEQTLQQRVESVAIEQFMSNR